MLKIALKVVGATFAYFSVSLNQDTTTTTVTGKVGKVPTITLENSTPNLYINLSTTDMAKENQKTYWALTTNGTGDTGRSTTKKEYNIATITTSNSDEGTNFSCTGNVKVTLESGAGSMGEKLVKGDAKVIVKGYDLQDETGTEIDLADLRDDESGSKIIPLANFKFVGDTSKNITAEVQLTNTGETQNDLAEKTLSVTIETESMKCDVTNAD